MRCKYNSLIDCIEPEENDFKDCKRCIHGKHQTLVDSPKCAGAEFMQFMNNTIKERKMRGI
jgi:hypothetical protein